MLREKTLESNAPRMHPATLCRLWRPGSYNWSWCSEAKDIAEELHELRESIYRHGILVPVLLGPDMRVWDGHHRVVLGVEFNIPIPFCIWEEGIGE